MSEPTKTMTTTISGGLTVSKFTEEVPFATLLMLEKITKLDLKSGDTILVRCPNKARSAVDETIQWAKDIHDELVKLGKDCLVLVVESDADISALPEGEMERNGWVRKEKVDALAKDVLAAWPASPPRYIAAADWAAPAQDIKAAVSMVKERALAQTGYGDPGGMSEGQANVLEAIAVTCLNDGSKPEHGQIIETPDGSGEIYGFEQYGAVVQVIAGGRRNCFRTIDCGPCKAASRNVSIFKATHRAFRASKRAGNEIVAVRISGGLSKLAESCTKAEKEEILRFIPDSHKWFRPEDLQAAMDDMGLAVTTIDLCRFQKELTDIKAASGALSPRCADALCGFNEKPLILMESSWTADEISQLIQFGAICHENKVKAHAFRLCSYYYAVAADLVDGIWMVRRHGEKLLIALELAAKGVMDRAVNALGTKGHDQKFQEAKLSWVPAWAPDTKPADSSPTGDNPFYRRK